MPLLKNKEYPSHEECQSLSKEDLMEVIREIDEYNKQVAKSLGCKLFYLSTTPSRELTVLPYSPSPSVLTNVLLEEVLCFYKEEIEHCKKVIAKNKEDITRLEARIAKANVDLYDKINKEIDTCYENIGFEEEELEHYQFLYNKFSFLEGIIENESNSKDYELIYTKY